jgi:Xaa-Pro aminopeptidase
MRDLDAHAARRTRLAERLGDAALVLPGGDLVHRSLDTEFPFRPDSDFYYLTGLAEPGAVLVFRPGRAPEFTLFVRPLNRAEEIWTGRRVGPQGAVERFGADLAHPISALSDVLPDLLDGVERVVLPFGRSRRLDASVHAAMDHLRRRNRMGACAPRLLEDARVVLGEARLRKDDAALGALRRAIEHTVRGHRVGLGALRPGMMEYELAAHVEHEFRVAGGAPGYGSIVGGGENAVILHYVENSAALRDGQLVLVDAGCEWGGFTGDLTRTSPVNGRFDAAQRELYDVVLRANEAGIAATTVGSTIEVIHARVVEELARGLVALGFSRDPVEAVIEKEHYKRWYTHRTSHWLGADVHDVGLYTLDRTPRPLEPGFVLTVEPGLYIAADDDDAPAAYRGLGIRIEDDVLVTADGPEVLTAAMPKRPDELEAIIGVAPRRA